MPVDVDAWVAEYEAHEHRFPRTPLPQQGQDTMKLVDTGGRDFEPAPVGNHIARCIGLIDVGTQQGEYQGKTTHARKIVIRWELPNELISEGEFSGKPFIVSKYYTASLSEKANLRKDLSAWRGRDFTDQELSGFDAKNILDKPCMVNVTHNEKGRAKVSGVTPIPKGLSVPGRVNDLLYFSLEPDEFKPAVFEGLGKYYKEQIEKSPEWADLHNTAPRTMKGSGSSFSDFESDIPF